MKQILDFAAYIRRQAPGRSLLAIGFLILGSVAEGASILLLIPVLQLIGPGDEALVVAIPTFLQDLIGPELHLGIGPVLICLVLLILVQSLFMRFKNIYMAGLLYDLVNDLRTTLFASIARARWQFITRTRGSDLEHALTADIDRIHMAAFHTMLLVQGCVLLLAYLCVSWLISPAMTGFAFVSGATVLAVLHPIRRRASAFGQLLTDNRKEQYRTVSEFLNGMKIAKSFNAEPQYVAELKSTLDQMRADFGRFMRVHSIGHVAFQISSGVVLAVFVYLALRKFSMPLPEIVVLVFLFMRVAPRFTGLQSDIQEILVNLPAFHAIQEIQAACEREHESTPVSVAIAPSLEKEVACIRLTFAYVDNTTVVQEVSFRLRARRITALIGPSGSGKSTIADMLMGLVAPTAGTITIDGVPLDEENRRAWRDCVAYVPQDVFLLHDTIAANLALASPNADEPAMWEALRAAHAAAFVERLPDRLQTVVGDRGIRLSGGERQRIALARALVRKPKLLILDEATSALDWETQRQIARTIQELRGSMTVLTIAHRPSMISFADWVVALEDGEVVEEGPYAALFGSSSSRLSRMIAAEEAFDQRR